MVTTDGEFPGGTRGQCGRVSVIAEPHSVAKGPPEWSYETEFPGGTRSNPDRRGVGVYATNGCMAHHRETTITTLSSARSTPYPVYRISAGPHWWTQSQLTLGGRKRSKGWGIESECESRSGEFGNQGGGYKTNKQRYPGCIAKGAKGPPRRNQTG
jgi:hypothetical protein